ncbi:alkyl hydroperoxide reductase AhpD [Bryobacterales bacterium F-183]|nr:alkyl hydroperoxide reductase AhpD [Bryobacterales bacterium F-183]
MQTQQRIPAIDPAQAQGQAKQLLDAVKAKFGKAPNMMRTMAVSPALLDGYLSFNNALSTGVLDPKFREQLALAVSQANGCSYCLSAHSTIGKMVGLNPDEIADSRQARSPQDPKIDAGLRFAQALVVMRGKISDEAFAEVKAAGWDDAAIAEIIAHVALNVLTNYFNEAVKTVVDFPKVEA